jgi:hypothetical protein
VKNFVKSIIVVVCFLQTKFVFAEITTLFCAGQISAENGFGHKRSGNVSTTIEFDDQAKYFMINDSSNLQRAAIFPYKEMNFFDSSIHWKTPVESFFGNGTFYGSINRQTGEMLSNYFVIEKTGGMVSINGKLSCEKQVGRRF